jgi:hypothetical protein
MKVNHHLEIALLTCEVEAQVVDVVRTRPHTVRTSARYGCNIPSFKQLIYPREGHGPHLRPWHTAKARQHEAHFVGFISYRSGLSSSTVVPWALNRLRSLLIA